MVRSRLPSVLPRLSEFRCRAHRDWRSSWAPAGGHPRVGRHRRCSSRTSWASGTYGWTTDNVKTGTVNFHWNQKGTFPNFGIADHTPAGSVGRVAYKTARYFKYAGRTLLVVGLAMDAYSVVTATKPLRQAVKVASGWAGAWVGCKVLGAGGAWVGTAVTPGIGTAVGGVVGCIAGGFIGYEGASHAAGRLYDWGETQIPARAGDGQSVKDTVQNACGSEGLERLILWPQFTGSEWQVPFEVDVADRILVAWRCLPDPVDAGPPPSVKALLVGALQKHAMLTFPSALLSGGRAPLTKRWKAGGFLWRTGADVDDAAEGIFDADFFPWAMQGQVTILGSPGSPPKLDERYLDLASEPFLFESLKSTGAVGVLLPGVDGAVAALYFFDTALAGAVRNELDRAVRAAGGRCIIATGEDFSRQLRD